MDALAIAVLAVFVGTYLVISSEKVNRTGMSLLGMTIIGLVFWGAFQLGYESAPTFTILLEHIEWETIMFVTAMMIIVAVAGGSGVFQFLALTLSKPSRGVHKDLYRTFLLFVFVTSLFLDTTSTMLIMAPLTIQVCKALDIDFKPFLISEAIVCNFASIPSIVGAVPNLVIAGETNLDAGFLFVILMPLAVILLLITLPIFLKYYEKEFVSVDSLQVDLLFRIDPVTMIKSTRDFYAAVIGFGILILGFVLGPSLQIQPAMVALMVAAALLILAHDRATAFLSEVGWSTIFFLVGLFGMVASLELTGIIDELGVGIQTIVGGNPVVATVFMVWIPSVLSAFLDNLPVSAVLAPIAGQFTEISPVLPLALVFAVNIGGYLLTPLGSPANMVAIAFSEKEGDPIPFLDFTKLGALVGFIHLAVGTGWLLLVSFFL
jgi:Na+/H+ antiporter NhaD/arsenite permease-like protein